MNRMTQFSAAGVAAVALTMSATASFAGYLQPGETIGVSLDSPLPEGIFAFDLENYGRGDKQLQANVGINIPGVIWSTPFSFYNTRLEFLAATPVVHFDGAVNRAGFVTGGGYGPILAHDFGGGFTGGVSAFVKPPSPPNIQQLDGRTVTEADFRESAQYVAPKDSPLAGWTFLENGGYTSALGQNYYGPLKQNDMFAGDFAIYRTFNKLSVGFVGVGNIDTDNRNGFRQASVELGGMLQYQLDKVTLQGFVTRSVYVKGGDAGVSGTVAGGYETRGWFRFVIPLYLAPTAAPAPVVQARF